MGLLSRLFGGRSGGEATPSTDQNAEHAIRLQQRYWTFDPDELADLLAQGPDSLEWGERLRLHHLLCMRRVAGMESSEEESEQLRQSVRWLTASDSPYRPQAAGVWQGAQATPGRGSEPQLQGDFLNPSLTHLGSLEVFRLDDNHRPVSIDFVGFDDLSGVAFASPALIRAAKLFRDDGSDELVFVPLLYGLTGRFGNDFDRAGQMTRFLAHLDGEDLPPFGATGIGVGQQDLSIASPDGGASMFGLGSVAEIIFPLDLRDPRFDEKARLRGIDPDKVREQMG